MQLICIRSLSTLLNPAEFAAYSIAVSLMAWYQLADLGFGNSAQNHVAEARARNEEVGHLIAASALAGGLAFCAMGIVLWPLSSVLAPLLLGKVGLPEGIDTRALLGSSGLLFVGAALGNVATKLLYALGKGVQANIIALLTSFAFLALLWSAVPHVTPDHRLLMSVLAYAGPLGFAGIGVLMYLGLRYGRWDWPGVMTSLRRLCARAWRFWLFAMLAAATLNVDYLIMSRILPAPEIAAYNVLARIFGAGMILYSGLLTAAWPAFSAMNARGDRHRVQRHVLRYLQMGGFAALALGAAVLAIDLPRLLGWIAPGLPLQVSLTTLMLFTIYTGLRIWTDTHAMALQAVSEVGIFLRTVPVQAVLSISLQWVLGPRLGIDGILSGLCISFILTVAWVLPRKFRQRGPVTPTRTAVSS